MKTNCALFKKQIETILKSQGQLEQFLTNEDFHLRLEKPGFQPLVIERHGNFVSITHYFEQNGDLIPDPDMELLIGADGSWYPVAIQFATGHYAQARLWKDGKEYIVPRQIREQVAFSAMWARNLKWQGW